MTGLLEGPSAPVSAYRAQPYGAAELDAHPDRDRIWATILALREEHDGTEGEREKAYGQGYEQGYDAGYADAERDHRNED
jgi:hypothetical protein